MKLEAAIAPTSSAEKGPSGPIFCSAAFAQADDQIHPANDAGADHLGDFRVMPAHRDELLQHPHVAGGNVLIQVVAGAVPLLGQFKGWVSE